MNDRKVEVLPLFLRREPELHFYARIGDTDYILPLGTEAARTLGACLILLADAAQAKATELQRAVCPN